MDIELIPKPESSPEPTEVRQKCMVCNSLVAKTFMDLNSKRIHLCHQDAFTILRMACKLESGAMESTLKFVEEQIYGKEE